MLRLAFASLLLAAAACTDPNAGFADLPDLHVNISVNRTVDDNNDGASPSAIDVSLGYDGDEFKAAHGGECATIDGSGVFNGRTIELYNAGQEDEDTSCMSPSFEVTLPLAPSVASHLELHDDRGNTITADIPAAARLATSAAGWTFKPGQHVTLDWSSPEDLMGRAPSDVQIWFARGNGNGYDITPDSISGAQISFAIPANAVSSEGSLDILIGEALAVDAQLEATTCTGAVRCHVSAVRGYEHTARIAP